MKNGSEQVSGQIKSYQEDALLVQRIQGGDKQAEEQFCKKHRPGVLLILKRDLGHSNERIEDLCHDVLMAVILMASDGEITKPKYCSHMIYTICKRKIADHLRRGPKHQSLDDLAREPKDPMPNPEEDILKEEKLQMLATAFGGLNIIEKRILYLIFVRKWKSSQVGGVLGLTADNVRQKAGRALRKMRKGLKGNLEEILSQVFILFRPFINGSLIAMHKHL